MGIKEESFLFFIFFIASAFSVSAVSYTFDNIRLWTLPAMSLTELVAPDLNAIPGNINHFTSMATIVTVITIEGIKNIWAAPREEINETVLIPSRFELRFRPDQAI